MAVAKVPDREPTGDIGALYQMMSPELREEFERLILEEKYTLAAAKEYIIRKIVNS